MSGMSCQSHDVWSLPVQFGRQFISLTGTVLTPQGAANRLLLIIIIHNDYGHVYLVNPIRFSGNISPRGPGDLVLVGPGLVHKGRRGQATNEWGLYFTAAPLSHWKALST